MKRKLIQLVIALGMLTLSGCVTNEQRQLMVMQDAQNSCSNYGFKMGTDSFSKCVMETAQNTQKFQAERDRQFFDDLRQQQLQQQRSSEEFYRQLIQPPRNPVRTNCYTYGNNTNCTSR